MVRSLQTLNQPSLIISYIKNNYTEEEQRHLKRDHPYAYQTMCQAAVELGEWDKIEHEPGK